MIFSPHNCRLIESGEKTVTRRRISSKAGSPWSHLGCSLVVGQTYAVCPGRNERALCRVEVLDVRQVRLGDIDEGDAIAEGYESVALFEAGWSNLHNCWDADELVWRIEFKVVKEVA